MQGQGIQARALICCILAAAGGVSFTGCGEGGPEGGTSVSTTTQASAPRDRGQHPSRGGEASVEDFGQGAAGEERSAILVSFEAYLDAQADRDFAAACAHLTATVRRSMEQLVPEGLGGEGCEAILERVLAPTAAGISRQQAEQGDVTRVRVRGDRAFVVFKAPGAELYEMTMVREGRRWRAALLTPAVLVPSL